MVFAAAFRNNASYARTGHRLGDLKKKTSIGNGHRKNGSFKKRSQKRYLGQGKR